jgi:LysR family nitrogen assimilation transcriptional regulator
METRRLEAFIKMVEAGSLTRAASQLGIAQPSLSQQVLDLEAHFRTKLLVRTKRGVTPTEAGRLLYRHSQNILRQLKQAKTDISHASDEFAGTVAIGMPGSISAALSLPLLKAVRAQFPGIFLRISEGSHVLMHELAVNGRLDFVIGGGARPKGLRWEPLLQHELVLVTSATNPPGSLPKSRVSVAQLEGHPLILPTHLGHLGGSRSGVDLAFARVGLEPNIIAEIDSPLELARAVDEGIASTIVPWVAADKLPFDLEVRGIVDPTIVRTISIGESEEMPLSAPAMAVRTLAVGIVAELVAADQWPSASPVKDGPLDVDARAPGAAGS